MYKVIEFFNDLQDNGQAYNVGDSFPRKGLEVSEKRLAELSTVNNKRKMPLIEEVKETKKQSGAKNANEVNTVTTKSTKKGGKKNAD